jgi:hypothetical protein
MIVELSRENVDYADRVAHEALGRGWSHRFETAGGLAAPERADARYLASRRAELAVAIALELPWNTNPENGAADVGGDVEVRYAGARTFSRNGLELACELPVDPIADARKLDRRFVLVFPAPFEPELPIAFELMGWARGREALELATYRRQGRASFVPVARLRPISELSR